MDYFGIGAAMRSLAQIYAQSARRSGRTTRLVESLKDGDRVVFVNVRQADLVRSMCHKRGVDVECIVMSPGRPHDLLMLRPSRRRTIFDHGWVEDYYLKRIEGALGEIDDLQERLSGPAEERGVRPEFTGAIPRAF
ncbi:MAG: hypothetical protein ABI574_19325 [Burkholderiales bacterium]